MPHAGKCDEVRLKPEKREWAGRVSILSSWLPSDLFLSWFAYSQMGKYLFILALNLSQMRGRFTPAMPM
jgi:hypothetical protein